MKTLQTVLVGLVLGATAAGAAAPRPLAVTVDDLPLAARSLHRDPAEREAITRDLRAWGVPERDIRTEAFAAATVKLRPDARRQVDSPAGAPLAIKFARSGATLDWSGDCDVLLTPSAPGEAPGIRRARPRPGTRPDMRRGTLRRAAAEPDRRPPLHRGTQ